MPGRPVSAVVVVGGGLAGVSVAGELRRRGYDGALTILDPGEVLHDRPPLSKDYLLGKVDDEGIALQPDSWFAEQSIDVRRGSPVASVSPETGEVRLADGTTLEADAVVLATGGSARRLGVQGADSERVHYLRTIDDARALRTVLVDGARLVVVGGGLIGAEIASTAKTLGATVTLVDPMLPLEPVVGREVAQWLHGRHAEEGVTVVEAGVQRLTDTHDGVTVHLTTGEDVEADAVVVGIGLVPETAVAEASGVRVDGGVVVDPQQRTSLPGVWAVGDCTRPSDENGRLLRRVEHWEGAMHGAARAAASILGEEPPAEQAHWFWSDRHGNHVEVVGDLHPNAAGADSYGVDEHDDVEHVVRGTFGEPPFALFAVRGGRLIGALSVDNPQAVRAARRLIDRETELSAAELADESVDLRKLTRR